MIYSILSGLAAFLLFISGCSSPVPPAQPVSTPTAAVSPTVSPAAESSPSLLLKAIKADLFDKKFDDVVAKCTEALTTVTDNRERAEILLARASAYKGLNQPDKARGDAIESLRLNPESEEPDLFLAIHIYSTGDMEYEAYGALHRAIDKLGGKHISESKFFDGPSEIKAGGYLMAGRVCHDCGKYDESLDYLNNAIDYQKLINIPETAYSDRAFNYFKMGNKAKAEADAEYWLKKIAPAVVANPPSFENCVDFSNMYLIKGDYDKAFLYLDKSKALAPQKYSQGTYHISRGRIYFAMGKFEKAKAEFEIVRAKYSGDEKILDMPDLRRMEEIIKGKSSGNKGKAGKSSDGDREKLGKDALNCLIKGDLTGAEKGYSKLISSYPEDPDKAEWLMSRADVYTGLKKFKQAEADLKEIIKTGKMGATPYLFLAVRIYSETEEEKEAWECLDKAFAMNKEIEKDRFFQTMEKGKPVTNKVNLAVFYMTAGILANDLGHYDRAIDLLTKAIQYGDIDDSLHLAVLEKAMVCFKIEKYDEARKLGKQWLEMKVYDHPKHYIAYQELADANMLAGDYGEAHKYIDLAIRMKPDDYGFYINKGRIYLMEGKKSEARRCFGVTRSHSKGEKWDFIELSRLEKLLDKK